MKTITVWSTGLNQSACMRKYDFNVNQLRVPHTSAPSLEKGTLVHLAAEVYYKGIMKGVRFEQRVAEALDEMGAAASSTGLSSEDIVMCHKTMKEYFDYYRGDPLVPIAVEAPFAYELARYEPDEDFPEGLQIIFEGKFDAVFKNEQQDCILVADHKSGSRNSEPSGLSNQAMGYVVAGQQFGAKRMMMINKIGFQKTLPAEKKFVRHILPYSKEVLHDWVEWTIARAMYIDRCQESGSYPPDFTKCDEYSGCMYKDVCLAPPNARQGILQHFFKVGEKHDVFEGEE